jgi:hypothetical protein
MNDIHNNMTIIDNMSLPNSLRLLINLNVIVLIKGIESKIPITTHVQKQYIKMNSYLPNVLSPLKHL